VSEPLTAIAIEAAALPSLALHAADETHGAPALPRDHPPWARDLTAISSRTRAALAAIRPVVVRVLTFWDHRVREIGIGSKTLGVDAAGCYRVR
jgi:hypothetical protein